MRHSHKQRCNVNIDFFSQSYTQKSYTYVTSVIVEQTMQEEDTSVRTKKYCPYHLCKTLSTNVLGEDKPGRHELNIKKKDLKTEQ